MNDKKPVALAKVEEPRTPVGHMAMIMSPGESKIQLQHLRAFVANVMIKDIDYGYIADIKKPMLFQPGAQKLAEIYGFSTDYEDLETVQDWEIPFFFYRKKCVLMHRSTNSYVGSGIGSCNSREGKYAYRWTYESQVPRGMDKAQMKVRSFRGKDGKAVQQFALPNDEIYSLVNTIEKMACKRAMVHAVIGATRSAGIFGQDMEDFKELASTAHDTPSELDAQEKKNGAQ